MQAALASPNTQQRKKKATVQRKDLVLSFVQDKQLPGEYFIKIENGEKAGGGTASINSQTGFADPSSPRGGLEKKLIPALDIKSLETVDSLTFSIILHDECLLNCYDVAQPPSSQQNKRNNRTSSLINAFGSILNNSSNQ